MKEIWKDIPDYEGMYQVSNLGRVKSLERLINREHKGKGNYIQKEILLSTPMSNKYKIASLWKNGKGKNFLVHQLMAMAFLNHKPNGHKIIIDHINNDSTDNRLENLQIITQRENVSKDKVNGSSKYTGVYVETVSDIEYIRARINIKNKLIHLGMFTCEKKASDMYQLALKNIKHYNGNDKEFREYLSNFY